MACLTSIIEPLRAANEISSTDAFRWVLISEQFGKVQSSALIDFDPAAQLKEIRDLDYLIILAPPNARFSNNATPAKLRDMFRHGVTLGAISGGIFPLARAGLSHKERYSVHWCYRAAFEAEFPTVKTSDQLLETGGRILTASGAAAGFDLALHLIEQRLSPAISTEVACWFQHPMMRKEDVRQAIPMQQIAKDGAQLPELVARAIKLFGQNLSEAMQVSEMADALAITPRHLERIFKKSTGMAPSRYFRKIRLEAARQTVMYTDDALVQIAASVGYHNTQVFRQHYLNQFHVTPENDRRRINLYRVEGNLPVPSI